MAVKVAVADVLRAVLDAETGARAFLLSGGDGSLAPYEQARPRVGDALMRLRALTSDNPAQQRKISEVEEEVKERLAQLDDAVAAGARADSGRSARGRGRDASGADGGARTMDSLRQHLAVVDAEENELLLVRRSTQNRTNTLAIGALVLASALFGFLVVLGTAWRRTAQAEQSRLFERARTMEFQERFVAILGHDLRNPLSSLIMGLALLRRTIPAHGTATIDRMLSSADRMGRMIQQILDLARSRLGGGIEIAPTQADLGQVVREVAEELRVARPGRALVLESMGDVAGAWDKDRLHQVVSNLIGNAMDHGSPHGPVRVGLHGNESHVVLSVHNGGPAIPKPLMDVLFDPFRRGDRDARTPGASGLGLGLYISRELVTAHGGRIELASSEIDGTTFTVFLPRGSRRTT
jgi:signal transduction histidine kinase